MGEARSRILNDIFYPSTISKPSCYNIPALENVSLNLSPNIPICSLSLRA